MTGEQRWNLIRQYLRSWRGRGLLLLTLLLLASAVISIAGIIGLVDRQISDQFDTANWALFGILFGVIGVSKHWRKPRQARLVRGVLLALCSVSIIWAVIALLKPTWIPNDLLELSIVLLTPLSLWLQGFHQQTPSQETSTPQQSDQG